MNDNELVCRHGQLARSCESCCWKRAAITLRRKFKALREDYNSLRDDLRERDERML